jgi:uncharacterized protein (PEP-CTERM system associated)
MRRAVFSASYDETVTTSSFQQSQASLFPLEDEFGNPIDNPGTRPIDIATNDATVTDQALLLKRFTFGMSLRGRRTDASVNFTNVRREYALGINDETINTLGARVSRRLSPQTSVNGGVRWQLSEFGGIQGDETLTGLDLGLSHTVFRDVTARLNYRYQHVSSDISFNSYTENRLWADVLVVF